MRKQVSCSCVRVDLSQLAQTLGWDHAAVQDAAPLRAYFPFPFFFHMVPLLSSRCPSILEMRTVPPHSHSQPKVVTTIHMEAIRLFYQSTFAIAVVPVCCAVVFASTESDERQLGIFAMCTVLTTVVFIIPLILFATYFYFFFSGAQTTKVEHRQFLSSLVADAVAAAHRALLCYLVCLMDAPMPFTLFGFAQFVFPCIKALVHFATAAIVYVTEGPHAAKGKGSINVALWQRAVHCILSGGKYTGGVADGSSASRYAQVNTGKATSAGVRTTSLRTANVECRVLDEGKHFNRVARGCLLP